MENAVYTTSVLPLKSGLDFNQIQSSQGVGADYVQYITACPPRSENIMTSLSLPSFSYSRSVQGFIYDHDAMQATMRCLCSRLLLYYALLLQLFLGDLPSNFCTWHVSVIFFKKIDKNGHALISKSTANIIMITFQSKSTHATLYIMAIPLVEF